MTSGRRAQAQRAFRGRSAPIPEEAASRSDAASPCSHGPRGPASLSVPSGPRGHSPRSPGGMPSFPRLPHDGPHFGFLTVGTDSFIQKPIQGRCVKNTQMRTRKDRALRSPERDGSAGSGDPWRSPTEVTVTWDSRLGRVPQPRCTSHACSFLS